MTSPHCSRAVIHGNSPTSIHSSTAHDRVAVPSRVNSIRLPRSTPRKSTTWRRPRWTAGSKSTADRWLNAAASEDRSFSKRRRSASESSIRRRSRTPAKASLRRRSRSTRSSGQAWPSRTEAKESTPRMAPPARSGINTFECVPRRSKLSRSIAAASGRSASRENRTTSPSRSLPDTQGNWSSGVAGGGSRRPGRDHESRSPGLPSTCSSRPPRSTPRNLTTCWSARLIATSVSGALT